MYMYGGGFVRLDTVQRCRAVKAGSSTYAGLACKNMAEWSNGFYESWVTGCQLIFRDTRAEIGRDLFLALIAREKVE